MSNVLLVYVNPYSPWMPMGICHISSYLKAARHTVNLFDTFHYDTTGEDDLQQRYRKERVFKQVTPWYTKDKCTVEQLGNRLVTAVNYYEADYVAFSIMTHDALPLANSLIDALGCPRSGFKVVVGGVVPTISPGHFLGRVDYVVKGAGELTMVDIADGKFLHPTPGTSCIIHGRHVESLDDLLYPNWGIMLHKADGNDVESKAYMYWPFGSKIYRFGRFDRQRGCPNKCQYCVYSSPNYPREMAKPRMKSNERMIEELVYYKDKYKLEYVTFNDDNFLYGDQDNHIDFLREYRLEVKLPFIVTLHAATVDPIMAHALRYAGCVHASIGVECGNEYVRKHVLRRNVSDEKMQLAFDSLRDEGIHTSSLNMIGLPHESYTSFKDTIELNHKLQPDKAMCFFFYPYEGTPLRGESIKHGYVKEPIPAVNFSNESVMNMPLLPKRIMYRWKATFDIMRRYPRWCRGMVSWLSYHSRWFSWLFSKYKEDKL